jgi:hypothetical protein
MASSKAFRYRRADGSCQVLLAILAFGERISGVSSNISPSRYIHAADAVHANPPDPCRLAGR